MPSGKPKPKAKATGLVGTGRGENYTTVNMAKGRAIDPKTGYGFNRTTTGTNRTIGNLDVPGRNQTFLDKKPRDRSAAARKAAMTRKARGGHR